MRPRKPRKNHVPTAEELHYRIALGQRIRALREEHYSQDEFAELIDVYRTHVSTIENGKTDLRLSTLLRIASVFGMDLGEFLAGVSNGAGGSGVET